MNLSLSCLLLISALLNPATALINADVCKCLPNDECWPKDEAWSQLNSTVNGRLIRSKPPASVCYPEESNYDPEACSRVFENWESSYWHADDPISIDSPPRYACHPIYPNGTSIHGDPTAGERGCGGDSYPVFVVNASSVSDVQAGVEFARRHSVKLNVKSTGHGRSSIPGSLSIWTHYFRGKEFHTNFVPQGANSSTNATSMAVTFGAGILDREAFEFAAEHDAVVVGGTDSTVGLVGWAGAGGHGYLTGGYGMGADSFLEVTVVTPSGEIVVANAYQHADLFWAIGGGGAGTWGVVVSLTVKAHPMPSTAMWSLSLTAQNGTTASEWYKVAAELFADIPRQRDLGLSGYQTLGGPPLVVTNAMFGYDMSREAVEKITGPLLQQLETQNSTAQVDSNIVMFPKWIDVFHQFNLTLPVGGATGGTTAARLLPDSSLTDTETFARVLENIGPSLDKPKDKFRSGRSISGTATGSSRKVDNALNPAWRDTAVHFIVSESWPHDTPSEVVDEAMAAMEQSAYQLRSIAPDSGAYINERGDFVPDWQKTLYGDNYSRLLAIKHKYDPESVQWCELCVGSDEWYEREDGRFCKQSWA
ncbi:hypothetical protein CB0940_05797 [Cercospora beticola]|uniref:FAD-binding PCMH-type domain-containing protein n=1 Tax=Cercospora beticola TaxID=122368 RepID=A0A2G5HXU3_CERBT|nr:hypothetical protein CB0940_05797 [Cercospora beticola]PIA97384.1 hypothetical protein CB0940_05797 [Cercospora beticola]WPA98385.1 hypothetical protein RHO25_002997 [Cercospora beticola]